MYTRIISILCALLLLTAAPAVAQSDDISFPNEEKPLRLKGKHLVAGNVGFLTELSSSSTVEVGAGVSVANDAGGVAGSLRYSYWGQEEFALDFLLGGTALDASVSAGIGGTAVESATITRLLVGVKYQPLALAMGTRVRPYVGAAVGPYFGHASDVRTGIGVSVESYTETAFGGRLMVGFDAATWKRLALGVEVGYGFATDFEERIGSENNYSSPEFAISIGALLGG